MPPGGVENRSEQLALVAGLLHERGTDPRLGELLAAVEGSDLLADPAAPAAVNVRALRREYDRFVRLPRTLVEDVARTTALAQKAWASARGAARLRARSGPGSSGSSSSSGPRPSAWGTRTSRTTRCSRTTSRASGARSSPGCSTPSGASWSPLADRIAGAPAPARLGGAAPALPARPPAPLRRGGRGRRGLRLRPRPHGPRRPPVVHRPRPRRLPHHAALRRPRLRRRTVHHSPRGRPRPVRAGPRPRALRHAAGRGRVGRHGRGAGPVLGEPGRAGTAASGTTSTPGRASSSPRAWATCRWTSSTSR